MKKNEYTKKLSEIKAPESSVEKAVQAALQAEKNRKELVVMPKKSHTIIKFISAAAACAVAITGIAIVSNLNKTEPVISDPSAASMQQESVSKSFSLVVNAAELTENDKINISELNMSGVNHMDTECLSIERYENKDAYKVELTPSIDFPVVCKGNGIEEIEYKIHGAAFRLCPNAVCMEGDRILYDPDRTKEDHDATAHKTLRIAYDDQFLFDKFAYISLKSSSSPDLAKDELTKQAQEYLENMPSFDEFLKFRNGEVHPELVNALFKAMLKDVTVDIIVHFTDGSSSEHTIAILGKDDSDGITMPVEIALVSEHSEAESSVIKGSGEYHYQSDLTLEKMKEIIQTALSQEENPDKESYYIITVPDYIRETLSGIVLPTYSEGNGTTPDYTNNKPNLRHYYALDSIDFQKCHKAIAASDMYRYVVYIEYDDEHNIQKQEVLYDMLSYYK